MNRQEATVALRKTLAYCPSQSMTELTPDAWAEALDDIRLKDALEAVRIIGRRELEPGKSRYIEPGHIRAEVRRIRAERLANHDPIEPPPGLSPAGYIEWHRSTQGAIASGRVIDAPALESRPLPDITGVIQSIDRA